MNNFIKYYSPNTQTGTKRNQSEEIEDAIIEFIADGGCIDVYDSCNRHISSHIDI